MRSVASTLLTVTLIGAVFLYGCEAGDKQRPEAASEHPPDVIGKSDAVAAKKNQSTSELGLDGAVYKFDVVVCFGTSTATVTASDSQDRDDHPVVSAKIYDPAMSGGHSINTFSALFENSEPVEHWILHEGTVEKSGDTIAASGTLKGSLLLPNDDGTRRSVPMDDDGVMSFEARIEC